MNDSESLPIVGFQFKFDHIVSRADAEYALFSIPTRDQIYPHKITNIFEDGHNVTAQVHMASPTAERKNLAQNLLADSFAKATGEYPKGFDALKELNDKGIIRETIEGSAGDIGNIFKSVGEGLKPFSNFGIIIAVILVLLLIGFFIFKRQIA